MYFFAFALAALTLFKGAGAAAVATTTTTAANFSQAELILSPSTNLSLGTHSVLPDTTEPLPGSLLLCPSTGCASCLSIPLDDIPIDTCIPTSTFDSVAISWPTPGQVPLFDLLVGPAGCGSFARVAEFNTCFNVNPAPFADYGLEPNSI